MAKVRIISGDKAHPKAVAIACKACDEEHTIFTKAPQGFQAEWRFNGDYDKPTFSPSVRVQFTKYENGFQNWEPGQETEDITCHFNITEGKIIYHGDCTHSMKGKTIELPDIE